LAGLLQGVYAYIFYKNIYLKKLELNKKTDSEFIKFTYSMSFLGILYSLGAQVDKVILFKFFSSTDLAGYWIATILPLEFQRMVTNLTSIYFPKLVNIEKENIQNKLLKILSISTMLTVCISLIYNFSAPYIFEIFFPQYLEYLFYSQLAFWGICFTPFAFLWSYFMMKGDTRIMYFLYIGDPILQIILYFVFVPSFGITGLIIATLVKNFLFNLFGIYLFMKK
jgi:O-antigen/teichoic acid export membrane protein